MSVSVSVLSVQWCALCVVFCVLCGCLGLVCVFGGQVGGGGQWVETRDQETPPIACGCPAAASAPCSAPLTPPPSLHHDVTGAGLAKVLMEMDAEIIAANRLAEVASSPDNSVSAQMEGGGEGGGGRAMMLPT